MDALFLFIFAPIRSHTSRFDEVVSRKIGGSDNASTRTLPTTHFYDPCPYNIVTWIIPVLMIRMKQTLPPPALLNRMQQ